MQQDERRTPAIELINVSRRFVSPTGKSLTALRDFNMTVERGEFVAVVGPTGCGKSTTLNLVTGLAAERRRSPPDGRPGRRYRPARRFRLPDRCALPWQNVIENVMAGPLFRGKSKAEAEKMAKDWLARVGLSKFLHHYPHQLSGGMRKRVSLAQTFINEPEILLMDEPFSALDVQTRTVMHEELLKLWAERRASVVFVTHDLEEAVALADKVYVLTAGPATVKSVYTIDLPRPRVVAEIRYEQNFIDYCKTIWDDLREEVETSYRRAAEAA